MRATNGVNKDRVCLLLNQVRLGIDRLLTGYEISKIKRGIS